MRTLPKGFPQFSPAPGTQPALRRTPSKWAHANKLRRARRARNRLMGKREPHAPLTRAQLDRRNVARRNKDALVREQRLAAKAAAEAERLRLFPWLAKPKTRHICTECFCAGWHRDGHDCAVALGRSIGAEKQRANQAAKAAWVCPPCPMPNEMDDQANV